MKHMKQFFIIYNLISKDCFEIQKNAIKPGQKVVIVDDLLATGGKYPLATGDKYKYPVTTGILPVPSLLAIIA